jgi:hypothetical protein
MQTSTPVPSKDKETTKEDGRCPASCVFNNEILCIIFDGRVVGSFGYACTPPPDSQVLAGSQVDDSFFFIMTAFAVLLAHKPPQIFARVLFELNRPNVNLQQWRQYQS